MHIRVNLKYVGLFQQITKVKGEEVSLSSNKLEDLLSWVKKKYGSEMEQLLTLRTEGGISFLMIKGDEVLTTPTGECYDGETIILLPPLGGG